VALMGYDLHITRKQDWFDDGEPVITEAEFADLLTRRPNLTEEVCWFNGNIDTTHPNDQLIRELIVVASELGAKVKGDDGEVYTEAYLANVNRRMAQHRIWPAMIRYIGMWLLAYVAALLIGLLIFWLLLYSGYWASPEPEPKDTLTHHAAPGNPSLALATRRAR
jgi:hypothetical protein